MHGGNNTSASTFIDKMTLFTLFVTCNGYLHIMLCPVARYGYLIVALLAVLQFIKGANSSV